MCGCAKPLDSFYEVKRAKPKVRNVKSDDRKPRCKSCYVAKAKEWAQKNPEKRKAIARKWDDGNSDRRKVMAKKYRDSPLTKEKNRQWRKENSTNYLRKRRQIDPMFAFKWRVRSLIRKAFDRNGYTKRSKSNDILGCTWAEFMLYIEQKFQPGMSWENKGEWHLDHIIPLATAVTEEDVIRLNHHSNLQPLWAADNLRKSDKLDYVIPTS